MYRFGENNIRRRHRHMMLGIAILVVLIIGGFVGKRSLHADTTISKPGAPVTKTVKAAVAPTQQVDEPLFSLSVPSDWKSLGHQTQLLNIYTWASTDNKAAGRSLSIYVDTAPATLGVNRALSVQANGMKLIVTGDVSDNCASFTGPSSSSAPASTPAKWSGVDFLCDLGNYQRDVVGTVSPDGLNRVVLTGSNTGQHAFFFTYTDNNIQADYSIFTNLLQSFRAK